MPDFTNVDAIAAWSELPLERIENFGDEGDFVRQYLLNPAIFAALGDVRGKRILDAGCGQGYLSRLLTRQGASLTGIEPSSAQYAYALRREQEEQLGITYLQADLSIWLPAPDIFDAVVANMVFMDIPDYQSALHNCVTALKTSGLLIFSLLHPCFEEPGAEWQKKGYVETRDYLQERIVKQDYGHFIHRPLCTYLNSVIQEGCVLQSVLEPQLDKTLAEQHHAERYWSVPGYLIVVAQKQ